MSCVFLTLSKLLSPTYAILDRNLYTRKPLLLYDIPALNLEHYLEDWLFISVVGVSSQD